ncbi:DUF6660 family protein [Mesonia sp. HuA40]|uniref:DUF6660 family protein n=1 Tax=Mesonia sp. HuA40 TaxID=2602761 RepID=UPI0011CA960E|nr:DUF6660 family protein [Mesonia sp. HuA40]TXK70599.1 hypothetical protein FT993_11820 [Mesonia sp. HuA40]
MRLVVFIFSVYLLGLNLVPCDDGLHNENNLSNSNYIEQTTANFLVLEAIQEYNDLEHHHEFDLCSPFCQCHCCHIHIISMPSLKYQLNLSLKKRQKPQLEQQFLENYPKNLLQPPQV